MGNPQRIPVEIIQAMKKILDALPDKHLGKSKEEALAMLNSQIRKAYAKGYSVKELAGIMSKGNVPVSAPTLRAHTCPSSLRTRKKTQESPKTEPVKPGNVKTVPARKAEKEKEPSFYTPDIPDTEL